MKINFLGATQNVTGSRFLVECSKRRILVDCGLYQEREFRARNWERFPVEPSSIDHVLLTHAHLDHCGYLPKMVKEGFRGSIFCTPPTAEIAEIALQDSASLQESDAEFKRRRHEKEGRKGPYAEVPLYTVNDARRVSPHFKTVNYKKMFKVTSDIMATFYDAGHILGASMIELRAYENKKEKIAVFSGDIGRWDKPILNDPHVFDKADYVFMESTYGNRSHEDGGRCSEKLQQVIKSTKEAGGNVVIPTLATERAQELLYYLGRLGKENRIPPLPTFMDSPMAIEVTKVFDRYPDYFDEEAKALLKRGDSLFDFPWLKMTSSIEESKAINHLKDASIIMSGSGMCTGGRIKYHLANNIARPESTVLFVSYQAKGTLGRAILEKSPEVRILGRTYPVRAKIEKINGFSAHADRDELLRWVASFKKTPEKIFIVHGEEKVEDEFASLLKGKWESEIIIPKYLEEYQL